MGQETTNDGSIKAALEKEWKWQKSFVVFSAYGGVIKNVGLAKLVSKIVWMNYLHITFALKPKIGFHSIYYQGHHSTLFLVFVWISWEGWHPFEDVEKDVYYVFPRKFRK